MSRESRFPHRLNRDGTFDSICRRCFATVASARDEIELAGSSRNRQGEEAEPAPAPE
jgi:hypothetical protein